MEVSQNGGTPSHHPFIDGIFPYKPSSYWGTPMAMETPKKRSNGTQKTTAKTLVLTIKIYPWNPKIIEIWGWVTTHYLVFLGVNIHEPAGVPPGSPVSGFWLIAKESLRKPWFSQLCYNATMDWYKESVPNDMECGNVQKYMKIWNAVTCAVPIYIHWNFLTNPVHTTHSQILG